MKASELAIVAEARAAATSGAARALRIAARLTQQEIASACGVSATTVAMWETGQRVPSGAFALEYGRVLRSLARMAA